MKYYETNNRYNSKINEVIKSIYDRRIENVKHVILKDYYSELRNYILSLKNKFYSLLSIATFNAFSEFEDDRIVIPSVGIEFLQNSRFIHDDIMFNSNFHDSNHPFHHKFYQYQLKYNLQKMAANDFGNNIGLLGGDTSEYIGLEAFFLNSFDTKLNLKAIEYYEEVSHQINEGMLIEMDMLNKNLYNISDYIEIISLKTGALVEKSMLIGANYAHIEDGLKNIISTYGMNLGILLQLCKDISGIAKDNSKAITLLDGHLRRSKISPVFIEVKNKLNLIDMKRMNMIIDKIERGFDVTPDSIGLIQKTGILESIKKVWVLYYEKLKDAFNKAKPYINKAGLEFFKDLTKSFVVPFFNKNL